MINQLTEINANLLIKKAPLRPKDLHKDLAGRALLLTGSLTYPGASWLTLGACLRSGVGYASIVSPSELIPSLASTCPSALYITRQDLTTETAIQKFCDLLLKQTAVLIGSGRGITAESELELQLCLQNVDNLLVDADALTILAEWQKSNRLATLLAERQAKGLQRIILLPHLGELKRLFSALDAKSRNVQLTTTYHSLKEQLDNTLTDKETEHLAYLSVVSQTYYAYVVGKGPVTYLFDPTNTPLKIFKNTNACNALAKAGSGDALAGLLCGLLAQGINTETACIAGIYVHGRASEVLSQKQAMRSVLPSDLALAFGEIFQEIAWN